MYKFDPDGEPVSDAFRAIALSQIDRILASLDAPGADAGKVVHEARRRCKKLRALLRLVRSGFSDFAKENAAIRDAAATLSHLRDADVLRQSITGLAEEAGPDAERLRHVAERLPPVGTEDEAAAKLADFRAALTAIRDRATDWSVDQPERGALIIGLKTTYRSGRRRMRKAERGREPVDLHEWRKASKYHGDQLDLLKKAAPELIGEEIKLAEDLASCLGKHHDLVVLAEAVKREPERFGDAIDRAALDAAIDARTAATETAAFDLGRQIFAERPKALARRFESYWHSAA